MIGEVRETASDRGSKVESKRRHDKAELIPHSQVDVDSVQLYPWPLATTREVRAHR